MDLKATTAPFLAKDARLPSKYNDLVNAVTAYSVCFKQMSKATAKEVCGHPLEVPTGKGFVN